MSLVRLHEDYKKSIIVFQYINTAAAKLLQSCPTLCDPRDGSPPGSPVPGIFQARVLEWFHINTTGEQMKIKIKPFAMA